MFRDRLRQWGMNDKNRRSAVKPKRKALRSAANRDKTSQPGSHYKTIACNSSRSVVLGHENVYNVLQTPAEILVLQRTLKGILDWQQHAEDSTVDLDFLHLLIDMERCLRVSDNTPSMCRRIAAHLRTTSAKLRNLMVTCTPLTILQSVYVISYLTSERNCSPWYYETSRFLVNAAVEALPDSHPSLLLLCLLFSSISPSQLVMIHEVGSDVMKQCIGEAASFTFRFAMLSAASKLGLSATMRSYADALCAATQTEATDSARLYEIATLYQSTGQYEKSSDALRRCLAQCEGESDRGSTILLPALRLLSFLQSKQNDFVGEEITLQKILKTTLARDRRKLHASQLSIGELGAISELETFYAYYNLNEKRDALHLEYPSAFEL